MTTSLLFNPSQASTEELESTFVGRHAVLDRIERDLLRDQQSQTPRHWQIVGPRGSGKSHLTALLARRMHSHHGWRVARLPEENYQIATLGELLEQIAIRSDRSTSGSPFATTADDLELQDRAVDLLRQRRDTSHKPLLVVLENLASLFHRQLKATRDQARLRDILTNNPPFVLLATSTSQSGATVKHSAPLFEFFQTLVLDDLTQADITELVRARADWEGNATLLNRFDHVKGRIEAIYHLSGGNPRLALALYRIVEDGVTTELHDQIMALLDEVTPYYQARLNDIPPQAARVLTEMAVSDTVVSPAEIGRRCRMRTNQVTAQIQKLLDERLIIQGGRPDARRRLYELKDRLLRIWLQMRESVGAAKRLRFLAEFFERWYADRADELHEFSRRTVSDFWSGLSSGDERRCVDRLKTLTYLADMRPGFDHSAVAAAMTAHVRSSPEPEVRAHIEALQRTFERSSDLAEHEALAFLLAECFSAIDAEEEGRRFLKAVIDEGSDSEAIALRYALALVAGGVFAEAFSFASEWSARHHGDVLMTEALGLAACGLGEFSQAFDFLRQFLDAAVCPHCAEKALRRASELIRAKNADQSVETAFWRTLIATDATEAATQEQIRANLDVLSGSKLSKIPARAFTVAAAAWTPLSEAPVWLINKGICGLAHRPGMSNSTLDFIGVVAEMTSGPLHKFVVDHLVEILPELRHNRNATPSAASKYAYAMSLVRQRTTPELLTKAFTFFAPYVAKVIPKVATDVIDLYSDWLRDGLLAEPITPYSEVVAVLASDDRAKALQLLHPETRDAVSLFLGAVRHESSSTHKGPDDRGTGEQATT